MMILNIRNPSVLSSVIPEVARPTANRSWTRLERLLGAIPVPSIVVRCTSVPAYLYSKILREASIDSSCFSRRYLTVVLQIISFLDSRFVELLYDSARPTWQRVCPFYSIFGGNI
ncbi:hypothetical protein TNCV_4012681 [Trichonephila clavipes]|nr:hypothetical protein TNCV_4012681 [Trichonephila clavipes]